LSHILTVILDLKSLLNVTCDSFCMISHILFRAYYVCRVFNIASAVIECIVHNLGDNIAFHILDGKSTVNNNFAAVVVLCCLLLVPLLYDIMCIPKSYVGAAVGEE
jgi:hypothetical protein